MESNIYANKPHDLYHERDLFGTTKKAKIIKNILESNISYFDDNNMIALYGRWGSGKTSVMDFLTSTLDNYRVVFFEAWKYEDDNNLPLSLFECILDSFEDHQSKLKDLIDIAKLSANTLFHLTKNLALNSQIEVLGIKLSTGQAAKDTIAELEQSVIRKSHYSKIKEFEENYNKLLTEYVELSKKKKILIFIDDLDRCEPDKVLNLLSSIKHFFTNNNKVVYFCGVDKLAVSKSISKKYQDMISSEEYLEKIFDITFNMPERHDIELIVTDFLEKVNQFYDVPEDNSEIIRFFLKEIKFTNPRKLKKVFNKYILLCNLAKNQEETNVFELIPANFNEQNPVQMVFILYVIILYEFYRDIFDEMNDHEVKLGRLLENFKDISIYVNSTSTVTIKEYLMRLSNYSRITYIHRDLFNELLMVDREYNTLFNILLLNVPTDVKSLFIPNLGQSSQDNLKDELYKFVLQFRITSMKIQYLFSRCILHMFVENTMISNEFNFKRLFNMAAMYF